MVLQSPLTTCVSAKFPAVHSSKAQLVVGWTIISRLIAALCSRRACELTGLVCGCGTTVGFLLGSRIRAGGLWSMNWSTCSVLVEPGFLQKRYPECSLLIQMMDKAFWLGRLDTQPFASQSVRPSQQLAAFLCSLTKIHISQRALLAYRYVAWWAKLRGRVRGRYLMICTLSNWICSSSNMRRRIFLAATVWRAQRRYFVELCSMHVVRKTSVHAQFAFNVELYPVLMHLCFCAVVKVQM